MSSRIRAAIVGTGSIAAVHARAIRTSGAQLAGVLGSTAERSAEVARAWQIGTAHDDLDALLADDTIDVVHVCTPNALHASQTAALLRAGKHVVCEKPLTTDVETAAAIVALAREVDRLVAVPYVYRYHPLVREIRARRIAGEFGAWQLLHGSYLQDWLLREDSYSWRVDAAAGGASRAFADIGSHWCDLVEWVAGVSFDTLVADMSTTVRRTTAGALGSRRQTEDVAAAMLRTSDGVLATLTVSQVSAGRKNRLWFELDGARSSAVFDQENPETVWLGREDGARIIARDPQHGSSEQRRLSVLPSGHPQGYAECFAAFVGDTYDTILGGAPEGLPTAADGLRSVEIIDAFIRSSDTRQWARIGGDPRHDESLGTTPATYETSPRRRPVYADRAPA